jgi:hypothetical protein
VDFDINIAVQLAQASNIAYGNYEHYLACYSWSAGAKFIPIDNNTTDIHAILIQLPDKNILAFRGTHSFQNWLTDAGVVRVDLGGWKVHRGFYEAHQSIKYLALDALKSVGFEKPLSITGHSLGAALSKLFALWIEENFVPHIEFVQTFGEPRWTNWQGVSRYEKYLGDRTWRVVDRLDPVAMIPFLLGRYRHTQNNVWIDETGGLEIMRPEYKKLPHQIKCLYNEWKRKEFEPVPDHFIGRYIDSLIVIQNIVNKNLLTTV